VAHQRERRRLLRLRYPLVAAIDNCETAGGSRSGPPAMRDRIHRHRLAGRPRNDPSLPLGRSRRRHQARLALPGAGFSSPERAAAPAFSENLTKPEVCAPGVNVYSCGLCGYRYGTGTSASGPHVAGSRSHACGNADTRSNPSSGFSWNARDGVRPEKQRYGWGFIDAYEAVLRCWPASSVPAPAARQRRSCLKTSPIHSAARPPSVSGSPDPSCPSRSTTQPAARPLPWSPESVGRRAIGPLDGSARLEGGLALVLLL